MQYIRFILESNSNKQLDALSKELVDAIRKGGSVKAGPIPSKGKRVIYCYGVKNQTYVRLMAINTNKYNKITKMSLESLERPQ
jgi:ribosomal protein S10